MPWKDAPTWLSEAAQREGWAREESIWRGLQERFEVEFPVKLDPIYLGGNHVGVMATGLQDPAPSAEFAPVNSETAEPTLTALHVLYRRLLDFKEEKTKPKPKTAA